MGTEREAAVWLQEAIHQADIALQRGDEPYGAVIVGPDGQMIATAGNEENTRCDPTAHAEILAIRRAAKALGGKSLKGCSVVCNYRPCPMCAAALLMTGIEGWYIGSCFDGPEALFRRTADKVQAGGIRLLAAMDDDTCTEQVLQGRKILTEQNHNYQSGHKNGII